MTQLVKISIETDGDLTPDTQAALALLLGLASTSDTPSPTASTEAVSQDQTSVVTADPPKPKRKRRTKAQIAADEAAAAEATPVEDTPPTVAAAVAAPADLDDFLSATPEPTVAQPAAPVAPVEVAKVEVVEAPTDVEAVKEATLAAVNRLSALQPSIDATGAIVDAIEKATGKRKIDQIDQTVYGSLVATLNSIAV